MHFFHLEARSRQRRKSLTADKNKIVYTLKSLQIRIAAVQTAALLKARKRLVVHPYATALVAFWDQIASGGGEGGCREPVINELTGWE